MSVLLCTSAHWCNVLHLFRPTALLLHMLNTVSHLIKSVFVFSSLVSPESDLLPNKRARLREVPEDEESSSLSSFTALSPSCSSAKQRSRRRCHFCRTKLELVQQEMGSCRCGTWMQLYTDIGTYMVVFLWFGRSWPLTTFIPSLVRCINDQSVFANLGVVAERLSISHYT